MSLDQIARDIREGTFPRKSEATLREEAIQRAKAIVEEAWRQTCAGPGEFDDYAVGLIADALLPGVPQEAQETKGDLCDGK